MSGLVNLRLLQPGTRILLVDGTTAEITANPGDGVWLFARRLSAPEGGLDAEEEMVFAQDVTGLAEPD